MKIHISLDIQEYPQLSISNMYKGNIKPDLIILNVIPVIMVGILGLYSLLVAFI